MSWPSLQVIKSSPKWSTLPKEVRYDFLGITEQQRKESEHKKTKDKAK